MSLVGPYGEWSNSQVHTLGEENCNYMTAKSLSS